MIDTFMFLAEETDRSRILKDKGKYILNIHPKISKTEVKEWIENIFQVEVIGLNTKCPSRKEKRRGKRIGYPVRYKQIIVSLKQVTTAQKTLVAAFVQPKKLPLAINSITPSLLFPISYQMIAKEPIYIMPDSNIILSKVTKMLPLPNDVISTNGALLTSFNL